MFEVEQKVRVAHDRVELHLREAGAERETSVQQRDTYFQHPERDFASTDEALRVRMESEREDSNDVSVRLTYKGPRLEGEGKIREEHETDVADEEALTRILEGLGCTPVATVTKHRTVFQLGEARICLDEVEDVGEFVEIEFESETDNVEAAVEKVHEIAATLGIGDLETEPRTYLEMVLSA